MPAIAPLRSVALAVLAADPAAGWLAPTGLARQSLRHHGAKMQGADTSRKIIQEAELFNIPFIKRPDYLDGTLAADWGFDPLNFAEKFADYKVTIPTKVPANVPVIAGVDIPEPVGGYVINLGANTKDTKRSLEWFREAEIKHARLAMLAAVGWPLAELWHGFLAFFLNRGQMIEASQGRAPSVLNGGLEQFVPFMLFVALAISATEVTSLDRVYGLTALGFTEKNGRRFYKDYRPGDLEFDPLNFYDSNNDAVAVIDKLRMEVDQSFMYEMLERSRRIQEAKELHNGRLAMLAITGFALQELVYQVPVVDQTPLFFTFFGEILAPGSFSQILQATLGN